MSPTHGRIEAVADHLAVICPPCSVRARESRLHVSVMHVIMIMSVATREKAMMRMEASRETAYCELRSSARCN